MLYSLIYSRYLTLCVTRFTVEILMSFSGTLLQWLRRYLTDRFRKVSFIYANSGLLAGRSGVLLGSIIGPMLFSIYVNNIFTVTTPARRPLFAEDSQCFGCIRHLSDCSMLQSELDHYSAWVNKR